MADELKISGQVSINKNGAVFEMPISVSMAVSDNKIIFRNVITISDSWETLDLGGIPTILLAVFKSISGNIYIGLGAEDTDIMLGTGEAAIFGRCGFIPAFNPVKVKTLAGAGTLEYLVVEA